MACGGMIFIKNFKFWKKQISFCFISFDFLCYYCCSVNLKRLSEHSGLRPDTSSLVKIEESVRIVTFKVVFLRSEDLLCKDNTK